MVSAVDLDAFDAEQAHAVKKIYSRLSLDLSKHGALDERTQNLLVGSIISEAKTHIESGNPIRHPHDVEAIASKVHEELFGLSSL
ncbi:hypothetical protein [Beijerinckia sp. L45]|uniref:hypothetical protein n=1 Tax=Beijerinckia sp. L45 TaxID=1641855 RepID=UPI00131E3C07|nr:hypothetical protein [Beijerinckia sp. L45]